MEEEWKDKNLGNTNEDRRSKAMRQEELMGEKKWKGETEGIRRRRLRENLVVEWINITMKDVERGSGGRSKFMTEGRR